MHKKLIIFEQEHFEALMEEFLKDQTIREMWDEFVYTEYINSLREPEREDN